jgi:hypothetical protein
MASGSLANMPVTIGVSMIPGHTALMNEASVLGECEMARPAEPAPGATNLPLRRRCRIEHPHRLAGRQPMRTTFLVSPAMPRSMPSWPRWWSINLRFHHAMRSKAKLRTFASFLYQAGSWKRPRKVVARLECSLQPVAGSTGMRQKGRHPLRRHLARGLGAAPLRERLLPARADGEPDQAAQSAAGVGSHVVSQRDRQSGAARSPHRRVLADARRARRDPAEQSARHCEFATIRERLIKIGARMIEHIARIRVQLPTSCPEGALFRVVALGIMPSGP